MREVATTRRLVNPNRGLAFGVSRRDLTKVAWHEVPGKSPWSRPGGYGVIGSVSGDPPRPVSLARRAQRIALSKIRRAFQ